MISLEFLITSLVVVLIPGTGVIYTVSTGLVQGKKGQHLRCTGLYRWNHSAPTGHDSRPCSRHAHQRAGFSTAKVRWRRVPVLRRVRHLAR